MLLIQLPDGTLADLKGCKIVWVDDETYANSGWESAQEDGLMYRVIQMIDPLRLPNYIRTELERLRSTK